MESVYRPINKRIRSGQACARTLLDAWLIDRLGATLTALYGLHEWTLPRTAGPWLDSHGYTLRVCTEAPEPDERRVVMWSCMCRYDNLLHRNKPDDVVRYEAPRHLSNVVNPYSGKINCHIHPDNTPLQTLSAFQDHVLTAVGLCSLEEPPVDVYFGINPDFLDE